MPMPKDWKTRSRWNARASQVLLSAMASQDEGVWRAAASRNYFSLYQAVVALLLEAGVPVEDLRGKDHNGKEKSYPGHRIVLKKASELANAGAGYSRADVTELQVALGDMMERRAMADYGPGHPTKSEVLKDLQQLERLLGWMNVVP